MKNLHLPLAIAFAASCAGAPQAKPGQVEAPKPTHTEFATPHAAAPPEMPGEADLCHVVEVLRLEMSEETRAALAQSAVDVAQRSAEREARKVGMDIEVLDSAACFPGSLVFEMVIRNILLGQATKRASFGFLSKDFEVSRINTVVRIKVRDRKTGEVGEVGVAFCGLEPIAISWGL